MSAPAEIQNNKAKIGPRAEKERLRLFLPGDLICNLFKKLTKKLHFCAVQ